MKKIIALMVLLSMALFAGCSGNEETPADTPAVTETKVETPKAEPEKEPEYKDVVLYFSDNQGIKLHPEERSFLKEEAEDPKFIVRKLIEGTDNTDELCNVIPITTTVNSCEVKDGLCRVDLSEDFLYVDGDAAKEMAIYSIVNSLCLLDGIEKVEFVIDGEKTDLLGYYGLDQQYEADMEYVAE